MICAFTVSAQNFQELMSIVNHIITTFSIDTHVFNSVHRIHMALNTTSTAFT